MRYEASTVDQMRTLLKACVYVDPARSLIEAQASALLTSEKKLAPRLLQFHNAVEKRDTALLQISGEVMVPCQGKEYPVKLSMCVIHTYPRDLPLVKITNPDLSKFETSSFYTVKLEENSYSIPLEFNMVDHSLLYYVRAAKSIMAVKFPFKRKPSRQDAKEVQPPPPRTMPNPFLQPDPKTKESSDPRPKQSFDLRPKELLETELSAVTADMKLVKQYISKLIDENRLLDQNVFKALVLLRQTRGQNDALEKELKVKAEQLSRLDQPLDCSLIKPLGPKDEEVLTFLCQTQAVEETIRQLRQQFEEGACQFGTYMERLKPLLDRQFYCKVYAKQR